MLRLNGKIVHFNAQDLTFLASFSVGGQASPLLSSDTIVETKNVVAFGDILSDADAFFDALCG